jgi:hypothetical protein
MISQQSSWDVCLEISSSVYSFNTTSLSDFAMVTTYQKMTSMDSFGDTHAHTDNGCGNSKFAVAQLFTLLRPKMTNDDVMTGDGHTKK